MRVMEDRYKNLPGSLLEATARLFTQNVRLVVHPMPVEEVEQFAKTTGLTGWTWSSSGGMVHADELHTAKPFDYLYKYLLSAGLILPSKAGATRLAEAGF